MGLGFSVAVPLYLIARDPSPNQCGFNFYICLVTPTVLLFCVGWLHFDLRLRSLSHIVWLLMRTNGFTIADGESETRGQDRKRPFSQQNAASTCGLSVYYILQTYLI